MTSRDANFERRAAGVIAELLGGWLGGQPRLHQVRDDERGVDFIIEAGGYQFIVEAKASGAAAAVRGASEQIRRYARSKEIPLVAVPFMGPTGREICERAGVSWIDLSGNAHIAARGLLVHVEGKPNAYKRVGRPSSVFSPVASRIARRLLTNPGVAFSQRQLAHDDGLDEGYVSRTVSRMVDLGYVTRMPAGVRLTDPALVIDAWREAYEFSRHRIVRAHVPTRSSEQLLHDLAKKMEPLQSDFAATGLAAASLATGFAGFRLVTFFVDDASDEVLGELGARRVERGENLWLVEPNDPGVLVPRQQIADVWCVHKVQMYLDLKGHPERSAEAADSVRRAYLDEVAHG